MGMCGQYDTGGGVYMEMCGQYDAGGGDSTTQGRWQYDTGEGGGGAYMEMCRQYDTVAIWGWRQYHTGGKREEVAGDVLWWEWNAVRLIFPCLPNRSLIQMLYFSCS